jgi:hypothetical protein
MWSRLKPQASTLRFWQVGLLIAVFVFWHVMTQPGLLQFPQAGVSVSAGKVGRIAVVVASVCWFR